VGLLNVSPMARAGEHSPRLGTLLQRGPNCRKGLSGSPLLRARQIATEFFLIAFA
jgi:hypothetical protein